MTCQALPRFIRALGLFIAGTALCASASADDQFAIAGFAIGQEMKVCPQESSPMRKGVRDTGIACRFPNTSQTVFGIPADEFMLAADPSGKIESIIARGIDAAQAAAKATDEFGVPDHEEANERLSVWAWQRGEAQLLIFHHPDEPDMSNVILNRFDFAPRSKASRR